MIYFSILTNDGTVPYDKVFYAYTNEDFTDLEGTPTYLYTFTFRKNTATQGTFTPRHGTVIPITEDEYQRLRRLPDTTGLNNLRSAINPQSSMKKVLRGTQVVITDADGNTFDLNGRSLPTDFLP